MPIEQLLWTAQQSRHDALRRYFMHQTLSPWPGRKNVWEIVFWVGVRKPGIGDCGFYLINGRVTPVRQSNKNVK